MTKLHSVVGSVIWVAIIVVIALGAAGLVTALDHPPGSTGRTDLSTPGDAEVIPQLDAAEAAFSDLADQVDALGIQARTALAALNGADPDAGEAAIQQGDVLVSGIITRTQALRRALAVVPYVGTPEAGLTVSDAVVARHATLVAALDATDGLDTAWTRLGTGSVAAASMSRLLAEHDRLVVAAAERGVSARYASAIEVLDRAKAQIAAARAFRDRLGATVDLSVLDEWLVRNENYDDALQNLYTALSKVGTRITAETRAAVAAEADARALLPPDTRGLVIIMAEIGQGGMSRAVITIEEARAKLTDALEAGARAPSEGPDSTDGP